MVHANAGHHGVAERSEVVAKEQKIEWRVATQRSKIKAMGLSWVKDLAVGFEKLKARVRARVEPPFRILENLFRYCKVRYRGQAKNIAQLHPLFALANGGIAKRALLNPRKV